MSDDKPLNDNTSSTQDYSGNSQSTDDPVPTGQDDTIDDTNQLADSNIDQHEAYDEGLDGAVETTDSSVKARSDEEARKDDHRVL